MHQYKSRQTSSITLIGRDSVSIHKQARSFYNSNLKKWTSKKYVQTVYSVISSDPDVITIDSDDDSVIIDCDQNHKQISNTSEDSATRNKTHQNFEATTFPEANGFDAAQKYAIFPQSLAVNRDSITSSLLLEVDEYSCSVSADDSLKDIRLPLPVIEIGSDSNSSIENVVIPSSHSISTANYVQSEHFLKPTAVPSVLQEHINRYGTRYLNLKDSRYAQNLKIPNNFQLEFTSFCEETEKPCIHAEQLELNAFVHNNDRKDHCVQQNTGGTKFPFASSWHIPISSHSYISSAVENVSRRPYAKKNSNSKVKSLSFRESLVRPRQLLPKSDKSRMNGLPLAIVAELNGCASVKGKITGERANRRVMKHRIKHKGRESRRVNKKAEAKFRIYDGKLENGTIYASDKRDENGMKTEKEERKKERKENIVEKSVIETLRQGERPMAIALMDLGKKLVSKKVINGIIKASKKSIDLNFQNRDILLEYHTELKWDLRPFQLGYKVCPCRRFKSESSNILLAHQEHGASFRIYQCCFCSKMTKFHRSFYQHMTKRHRIIASKFPKQFKYSCTLCSYETNVFVYFQSHQKQCVQIFCEAKNLYPCFEDFDIPVRFNDEQDRLVAKKTVKAAKLRLKAKFPSQVKVNLKKSFKAESGRNLKLCNICGKSFLDRISLDCHIRHSHHYAINKKPQFDPKNQRTKKCKNPQAAKMLFRKTRLQKQAFRCCFCSEFLGKDALNHIHSQHDISLDMMVKKLYCYLCEHSVHDVSCFESHMLLSHSELFPNYKKFWKQVLSSLKSWRQSISLDYADGKFNKPWQCIYCDKRFTSPSIGYRHLLLIHTVEKIECQICGKMISSGATYTEHIQRHVAPCYITLCKILKYI